MKLNNISKINNLMISLMDIMKDSDIRPEDIRNLAKLDESFAQAVDYFTAMFNPCWIETSEETPVEETTKEPVEEATAEATEETVEEIVSVVNELNDVDVDDRPNLSSNKGRQGLRPEVIERVCSIIKDVLVKNPSATKADFMRAVKPYVGYVGLTSILKGNYTTISEKYFVLINGVPHLEVPKNPDKANRDNTKKLKDIISDNNGDILSFLKLTKDIAFVGELFTMKREMHKHLNKDDFAIVILVAIHEGNRTVGDVNRYIHHRWGALFMPPSMIQEILDKKIYREYADIIF